jgi:hypothetical protein
MKVIGILLILILLMVGCAGNQNGSDNREDPEINSEQGDESNMGTQETRPLSPWFLAYLEERDKINVDYIISGSSTPADRNVDLRTIERFVFSISSEHFGEGFVLDRMHNNRVYYNPRNGRVERLESIPYSAELKDEDLERLIEMIEKSGMRDWESHYGSEPSDRGGFGWTLGILFADGTMMRSDGRGGVMPQGAGVLLSFIREIGTEIQERHHAEAEQSAQ